MAGVAKAGVEAGLLESLRRKDVALYAIRRYVCF